MTESTNNAESVLIAGKYRLIELLGRGGSGEVYRAINVLLDRHVALKILRKELQLDETAKKRFFREARTANRVRHPNVVDVLDVGDSDLGPWMVQELLEGESLADMIGREGSLSPVVLATLLLPMLGALSLAHQQAIAHRDLKPENIFLERSPGGRIPKLLDFGLSKPTIAVGGAGGRDSDRVTARGVLVGTPAYLAPERIRMENDGDVAGDIWSVGVVLYECSTGFLPYAAKTVRDMFYQIATQSPMPIEDVLADIDPVFAKIVMRCLREKAADRYPTAAQLEDDLRAFLQGNPIDSTQRVAAVRVAPVDFVAVATAPADPAVRAKLSETLSAEAPASQTVARESAPPSIANSATESSSSTKQNLAVVLVIGSIFVVVSLWMASRMSGHPPAVSTAEPRAMTTSHEQPRPFPGVGLSAVRADGAVSAREASVQANPTRSHMDQLRPSVGNSHPERSSHINVDSRRRPAVGHVADGSSAAAPSVLIRAER
ncbi:MAG: serine/threonine-protein kinase [Deltaproteobacteria bacterium]|nr:serine/threonine-protein kinase [Deltaproteobacteria bacterium]